MELSKALRDEVRNVIQDEFAHVLKDISFRIEQTYDLLGRVDASVPLSEGRGKIYAEDLNLLTPMVTGYTLTNNSPVAGSIAWVDLHIVYNGVDNTITNGNTAMKYAWWAPATSATVLQTGNTKPNLLPGDVLVFVNNGGVGHLAIGASLPVAVGDNAVDTGAIVANAVTTVGLADNAVTSGQLANGAVTRSAQLGANVVTNTAIADGSVSRAGQLAANVVTGTAIADGSVLRAGQLAANVVSSGKIADGAINRSGILAANTVAAGAVADGAINRSGILGTAVVTSGAVATNAIATAALQDGAVSGTKVANGAVGTTKLNTLQHLFY